MQVSTATLRAGTTTHCHTESLPSPAKGGEVMEQKHSQARMALKTNCTFSHSWQAKHLALEGPVIDPREKDGTERPLISIGSTQTLPRYLATFPHSLSVDVHKKATLILTLPLGPSTVFCVAVTAWIVVISPSSIPKLSFKTLATGARQLVVQDALLQDRIQRKVQLALLY